ncbi:hypothetical protein E1161_13070 [Saccharopolyspora aridisoli]|uniref:Magnesium transporter n=1 Tax=Saccharopolyspora aridisoli TaxID=2530385 RepID=A0A4R4UKU0_9PSEU|nr:hypothetical protein [Saccharopolyspora aridisoli]TDC92638.1 hypothetical protein E1161_13070 [Saccharopolyspora aridisoli]
MSASVSELPLFAGASEPPELGVYARVAYEIVDEEQYPKEEDAFERAGAPAFRVAPLLRLIGARGARKLIVGRIRIAVTTEASPQVTVVLSAVWSERDGWTQVRDVLAHADDALAASLADPAHPVRGDEQTVAAILAKAIAESSHNELTRIRAVRYELERRLADQLASRRSESMRPLLAEAIELSIAFNRARDQARAVIRDGLWLWLCDEEAYQRSRVAPAPGPDAPTSVRMHHNALRHCESMSTLLEEETSRLHSLLDSLSTVSVAQDAEAQQNFNLFAAATAAGLGLPALILSFYGAQSFLPLNTVDRAWRALIPIGVTTLVAVVIALYRMPRRARPTHYVVGALFVVALVGVLGVAGALAPR